MKYCSACGHSVTRTRPKGDDRLRDVCPACGTIHYQNPKMVVGCMVELEDGILLCRRSIEPALGRWTVPAGYLELEEGVTEGARRETWEEARAEVHIHGLHAILDIPHISQTYLLFRASLAGSGFGAGEETLESKVFDLPRIPWDELAFPSIQFALRLHVEDRQAGQLHQHSGIVEWDQQGSRYDWKHYRLREHRAVPVPPPADPELTA